MGDAASLQVPFTFPPQQPGEPSTRNWYQELLDHPECANNPAKIQEAYESFRTASLERSIGLLRPSGRDGSTGDRNSSHLVPPTSQRITPDEALIRYLKLQTDETYGAQEIEQLSKQDVNCLVIWTRPDPPIMRLLLDIQRRLSRFVGPDLHLTPPPSLHLSIIELSHRHPIAHLHEVYAHIGEPQLKELLDTPRNEYHREQRHIARLVKPKLLFDKLGVAISFVPAAAAADDDDNESPYTYHHLRSQLHMRALTTGVSIDTCYTAPIAHVTLGRFVGTTFFQGEGAGVGDNPGRAEEQERRAMERWVGLIMEINEELERECWGQLVWEVGRRTALEVQLGYIKFGRGLEEAELVGEPIEE
ncbi:hypothetical protein ASPACDRAFT_1853959 [Aspergillus aculeatus ATCC 16872]|uniref:RNA ligase/cyclic nucleotide phosphodiesterase n=1 Tax=Aspergillus aculeatus (strain ATCC 16872 / CBS 172.66 / WB 5094) TaxID=690307 RepID=A0A1L9X081_ASPA1|nr:uncharacterized protein ASPACDRAFT_1853959 [Aspergillus aculeatus ATCC 16872]OJK01922.1 hypothetical protein ASPACDRAFT_1853959 [Aspergillus aculeatus ATCC 16872]